MSISLVHPSPDPTITPDGVGRTPEHSRRIEDAAGLEAAEGPSTAADERRVDPRHRVDEHGLIALDEHTSVACLVYDLSHGGVRIVAIDAQAVPPTFLLASRRFAEGRVCSVVWRTAEEIGARFVHA